MTNTPSLWFACSTWSRPTHRRGLRSDLTPTTRAFLHTRVTERSSTSPSSSPTWSSRDSQLLDDALRAQYDAFFVHQAELLENWYLNAGDTTIDTYVNRNSRVAVTVAAATIALAIPDHPSSSGLLRRSLTRVESQMARWWRGGRRLGGERRRVRISCPGGPHSTGGGVAKGWA